MSVLDVGFDLGSTMTKSAAVDEQGRIVAEAATPMAWRTPAAGWAERPAPEVFADIDHLLAQLAEQCPGATFRSIGFTGMAETGSVVRDGVPTTSMIAWFDPRGTEQMAASPASFQADFPGRTGLPVTPLATLAKLLWMRSEGVELAGGQWLTIPELAAWHLGALASAERSSVVRTGLYDLHTDGVYAPSLELLGLEAGFVPAVCPAGAALGRVRADHPVAAFRGAVLTVAGHDHLVAAAAVGASKPGTVSDSFGTSEAFVGASATLPSPAQVAELVGLGMNVAPHVVRDTTAFLGGSRSGIVLTRVLRLLGENTPEGRRRFDEAAFEIPDQGPGRGIHVAGAAMNDHVVSITLSDDDVSPEGVWRAALEAASANARGVLDGMRRGGLQVEEIVLLGGYSQMASVFRARQGLAPRVRRADVAQPGLVGAARLGAWAATQEGHEQVSPPPEWFTTSKQSGA